MSFVLGFVGEINAIFEQALLVCVNQITDWNFLNEK
jgi:hypothetical protein